MRIHCEREGAFTAAECDRLIALAEARPLEKAPVYGGPDYLPADFARRVFVSLQERSAETAWLFDRLDSLFVEAAAELGVDVAPMAEPVQILRYGAGDHFQAWHTDAGFDRQEDRLLSVSVELCAAGEHDGGDLEILPDLVGKTRSLPRGGARFFLSRALHRVTPVTRGVRWALVNWTPPAPPEEDRTSSPAEARETSAHKPE
jgi:PKHD-type hydroxylase